MVELSCHVRSICWSDLARATRFDGAPNVEDDPLVVASLVFE